MDRSDVMNLIAVTHEKDSKGVMRASETARQVFCKVDSVTGSEWFEGGRNGLNPEYRFTMFEPDYNGEEIAEYNNSRYTIYRTYHTKDDMIELYAERRKGNA